MNIDDLARRAAAEAKDRVATRVPPAPPERRSRALPPLAVASVAIFLIGALAFLGLRPDDDVRVAASKDTSSSAPPSTAGTSTTTSTTTTTSSNSTTTSSTTTSTTAPPSPWETLRGKEFSRTPPFPPGASDRGGGILGDADADPLYGYNQAQQGRSLATFFKVTVGNSPNGTSWRIIDIETIDDVGDDWLKPTDCWVNEQLDNSILAIIVSPTPSPNRQRPTYAWRINKDRQEAEPVDLTDVTCDVPVL
jgi:hypothetical protein